MTFNMGWWWPNNATKKGIDVLNRSPGKSTQRPSYLSKYYCKKPLSKVSSYGLLPSLFLSPARPALVRTSKASLELCQFPRFVPFGSLSVDRATYGVACACSAPVEFVHELEVSGLSEASVEVWPLAMLLFYDVCPLQF
jgi:hypothetical protein